MTRSPLYRDFLTGLFAIGALIGLAVTLVLFGETANVLQRHYRFRVLLTNSAGLGETSPVTLNGVKVGQVKSCRVRSAPEVGAEMVVEVRDAIKIPRSARVSVDKGFVGDASLEFIIEPGTAPEAMAMVIKDGDTFDGGSPMTLMDKITSTIEKPLQRLTATADSIEKLASTYTTVGERLSEMLEPRTPADVAGGKAPNIRSTIARLDSALADADAWLGDQELRTKAKGLVDRADKTLADLSELSGAWKATAGRVDSAVGTLEATATDAKAQVATVATQAVSMLKRAEESAGALTQMLDTATKGQGTMGQLMQNPDLYRSLKSTADRLDQVLVEIQLLVQKYKAEGIPIRF